MSYLPCLNTQGVSFISFSLSVHSYALPPIHPSTQASSLRAVFPGKLTSPRISQETIVAESCSMSISLSEHELARLLEALIRNLL